MEFCLFYFQILQSSSPLHFPPTKQEVKYRSIIYHVCNFESEMAVVVLTCFNICNVISDRVAVGRSLDLPVYFGDAGSREVVHMTSLIELA
jgi:hypothetical protein